jgi:CheY-like chemotaxis protein
MNIQPEGNKEFLILIAYDCSNALPIQHLRIEYGSNLVLTSTQNETKDKITSKEFNLIIVDLNLGGLSLLRLAKAENSINSQTPIIALVDKENSSKRKAIIANGFDDCLIKPLNADDLNDSIMLWRKNDGIESFIASIQALLANSRGNHSLALTLYKKLFDLLPQQIGQIENAIKTGQYQLAFDITHSLNGVVRTCYLQDLEKLATTLEACLIQKNYDFADGYFLMLQQKINLFINHRQAILDHLEKIADGRKSNKKAHNGLFYSE